MIGRPGKCPWKNGSLTVTFLIPTIRRPSSSSRIRSTSRNGYRWGSIAWISPISIITCASSPVFPRSLLMRVPQCLRKPFVELLRDPIRQVNRWLMVDHDPHRRIVPLVDDRRIAFLLGNLARDLLDLLLVVVAEVLLLRLDLT